MFVFRVFLFSFYGWRWARRLRCGTYYLWLIVLSAVVELFIMFHPVLFEDHHENEPFGFLSPEIFHFRNVLLQRAVLLKNKKTKNKCNKSNQFCAWTLTFGKSGRSLVQDDPDVSLCVFSRRQRSPDPSGWDERRREGADIWPAGRQKLLDWSVPDPVVVHNMLSRVTAGFSATRIWGSSRHDDVCLVGVSLQPYQSCRNPICSTTSRLLVGTQDVVKRRLAFVFFYSCKVFFLRFGNIASLLPSITAICNDFGLIKRFLSAIAWSEFGMWNERVGARGW